MGHTARALRVKAELHDRLRIVETRTSVGKVFTFHIVPIVHNKNFHDRFFRVERFVRGRVEVVRDSAGEMVSAPHSGDDARFFIDVHAEVFFTSDRDRNEPRIRFLFAGSKEDFVLSFLHGIEAVFVIDIVRQNAEFQRTDLADTLLEHIDLRLVRIRNDDLDLVLVHTESTNGHVRDAVRVDTLFQSFREFAGIDVGSHVFVVQNGTAVHVDTFFHIRPVDARAVAQDHNTKQKRKHTPEETPIVSRHIPSAGKCNRRAGGNRHHCKQYCTNHSLILF